jgi:hypothetical protein
MSLVLPQIPQCQFCELEAKYEAASTNPENIHNWVYVCEKDVSANAVDDKTVRIIQLA